MMHQWLKIKTVGVYEDGTKIDGNDPKADNAENGVNANLNRPSITIGVDTLEQRDKSSFDLYLRNKKDSTYLKLAEEEYSVKVNADGSLTYQLLNTLENSFGQGDYELVLVSAGSEANNDNTVISEPISFEVGYKFSLADFEYTDSDGDDLVSVIITSLPTSGQLLLNGQEVSFRSEISKPRFRTCCSYQMLIMQARLALTLKLKTLEKWVKTSLKKQLLQLMLSQWLMGPVSVTITSLLSLVML